ncbi:MAG TPA: hypothetical protein VGP07_23855 [Polyangia bacterium]
MGFRAISGAVVSAATVHRAERVPDWTSSPGGLPWRALCGIRVGALRSDGAFEFEVAVALDPESWRLAANCPACLAATERRELGALG